MSKYQAYPEYKDSGVEVIGAVPTDWSIGRLKQVVDQNRQITYGIVQAGPNIKGGIPYIRPADMAEETGVKNYDDLLRTSPHVAASYERSKIKTGDLICSIGPSFGKLMITPESLKGANLTQGTARVAISSEYNSRYFFWALRSVSSFQQWESSVGGATFRALNLGPLADTALVIPTKNEQNKIASFIDHETAKIDTLIDKQQQLIQLLKEKRQAVISHAVTKGLNPNAPMRDSGVEWLGEVPEHWITTRLKYMKSQVSNAFVDGPFGSNLKSEHFLEDGDVYVIESNFATTSLLDTSKLKKISKSHFETIKRSSTKGGDIIIAKIGARYGSSSILPEIDKKAVVSGNSLKLTVNESLLNVEYANELLRVLKQNDAMDDGVNVTAQPALSLGGLSNLPFLKLPIEEQNEIISYIKNAKNKYNKLISNADRFINLAKERRTALISAAVTGKIDVRHHA